jgi:tetratricopeptide (TPR) repeat protein
MIARLDKDDADGTHTRAVARAFQGQSGVERTQTRRVLPLSDIGSDAESRAVAIGRRWLARRNADLLIWGEVLQKEKFLNLWFTSKDATSDFQQSRFPLDANLLDQSFSETAREQLISVSLSAVKPASESETSFLRDILGPVAFRLRHLLNSSSSFTSRQRSELRFALGVTLCALSDEGSSPADLQDAVNSLASSLEDIDRRQEPLAWANAQHYRGVALMRLGQEVAGSETIENAVLAFRAALDERTREHAPLEWAKTQNALGGALTELGMRKTEPDHFDEAMIAFDAALTERTLERTPVDWASTMNNRAIAILNLGLRDKIGIHQIKYSIKVLQEALRGVSPKTEPILWGTTQLNLGVAFFVMAQRQPEGGHLDKALLACRSALSEWSRDQVPRLWVKAQLNIGRALTRLGELDIQSDYLREAEETFNAALANCPRESSPLSWARINAGLGIVLTRIAEREIGFQIPLSLNPADAPGTMDWVTRQQTLALNLGLIQRREEGVNCLERAVTAFRNSLDELPRDRLPVDWADTQHNFSAALVRLGEQEEDTEHLYQALTAVNFAL